MYKIQIISFLVLSTMMFCKKLGSDLNVEQKKYIAITEQNSNLDQDISSFTGIEKKYREEHDWGKYHYSKVNYYHYKIESLPDLQTLLTAAYENHWAVRIRGRGHSMNGSSLPRENEILLDTSDLRFLKVVNSNTIEVGSGVAVFDLNLYLQKYGYSLPVYNDGDLGPSIGGFISASGLAIPASQYGGFWENVEEISLVDGHGTLHFLNKDHFDFKWIFGSMGQLGVIYSVKLKIVPTEEKQIKKIANIEKIPEYWAENSEEKKQKAKMYNDFRLYWFTVMAPLKNQNTLLKQLLKIKNEYKENLTWNTEYIWPIKFVSFNPPLLYRWQHDFVAIGIWGYNTPRAPFNAEKMMSLQMAVKDLVKSNDKYSSYLQAELSIKDINWKEVWGSEIYREFENLKRKYDPEGILNRGAVFNKIK